MGRKQSEETKAKIGAANRGKVRSAEQRAKSKESHWTKKPGAEAIKEILRRKATGAPCSTETREKLGKASRGRRLSAETRAKMRKAAKARGEQTIAAICEANIANGRYRPIGETRLNSSGYVMEKVAHRRGELRNWQPQHRVVMERRLGRALTNKECVHHIDGNKTNNKSENLILLSIREHASMIHIIGHATHCDLRTAQIVLDMLFSRFGDDLKTPQTS